MNRFHIKDGNTITVLMEVDIRYDGSQYERPQDAADELAYIIENATDEQWDEYLHIRAVRQKGAPR
jgi:hypothetical protein